MKASSKLQVLLLLFLILTITSSFYYVDSKVNKITQDIYAQSAHDIQEKASLLIEEKQEAILKISLALSTSKDIQQFLLNNSPSSVKLSELSTLLNKHSTYKHVWFQIIDNKGISQYRSWTKKRGDSLTKVRLDVAKMIQHPEIFSGISTGKFDITFKAMVPIYHQSSCIGFIETIAKFNSIATKFKDENISPILLVDKKYKQQLKFAFTKLFIQEYYVANTNVSKEVVHYIKERGVDFFIHKTEPYYIDKASQKFIVFYHINDIHHNPMGYFLLFSPLESINLKEVTYIKNQFDTFIFSVSLFAFLLIVLIYFRRKDEITHFLQDQVEKKTAKIQEQKENLHYQANHDSLTNLPNRALFLDRLNHGIRKAKRAHSQFALLFLDLDRFKEINDSLGHHIGDEILKEVALRIQNSLRESDTIARLGGDEFTIILHKTENIRDIILLVQKLLLQLSKPIAIESNNLHVMSSIGISVYPNDAHNANDLLKNADAAMYKAKEHSKGSFEFYTPDLTLDATRRLELENSIRRAISNDEFVLHFQPQINSIDDSLVGFEVLVRWENETHLIGPDEFIPIAEATNLIIALGKIIIDKAFKQLFDWMQEGYVATNISINLSAQQINDIEFLSFVEESMKKHHIQSSNISFEITESYVMHNPQNAIDKLHKLKKLGFSIALDDFGTGYSSLSYLKKLPIDTLKIDKSFIDDIPYDEDNSIIATSIISLAKNMQLEVVAEGVEVAVQKDFLQKNGCIFIQGYLYSKPISPHLAKKFLKKQKNS